MRVGIVGSRRRNTAYDRWLVFDLVAWCIRQYGCPVIVSGGCPTGADFFAKQAARFYQLELKEHLPQWGPQPLSYREVRDRFYARNSLIAEDSDVLYALTVRGSPGGTDNTCDCMGFLGKPFYEI